MKFVTPFVVLLALFGQSTVMADDGGRGLEIAKDRKERDSGWGDSQGKLKMLLKNSQGETSERLMRVKSLEVVDDGDKGLTVFDSPRDVSGTAFLSFSHISKPDDQWLYLPALKKVKRISSRNKSGPFMGSEFAYEDMGSFEVEKFDFMYLRDEACPDDSGLTCHVLESIPTDKYSGYSKQVTWVDTEHLRPIKVDFYDRKKSLLKTLNNSDWKLYQERYWRSHTSSMQNHQTGKSTDIVVESMTFGTGLSDSDFNQATLKRAR